MEVQGGQVGNQTQGNPIWPTTNFTGPLTAGNVFHSDGTGNLAGVGETSGVANVGLAVMGQAAAVTQTGVGNITVTPIVIPAQSQILSISSLITKAWDGGNTTLNIGSTGNATFFGAAGTVQGNATGIISVTPATGNTTQLANWQNTGTKDIQIETVSQAAGNGTAILTVTYLQGINL